MKEKYLVYSWMGQLFATSINEVVEVMDLNNMVKTSREEIKLTTWKNRTMPVLDPVSLLTIDETKVTKYSKILLIEVKNLKVGFLVEKIIGIEELRNDELREPGVSEKRFVKNMIGKYKLVDFSHFVNSDTMPLIKKAMEINVSAVLNGEELLKERWSEREGMLEELKLESLNFLIESNRRKIDDYYINGMMKIHKMIEKM
jgi:chemotaxis signal transduction protein